MTLGQASMRRTEILSLIGASLAPCKKNLLVHEVFEFVVLSSEGPVAHCLRSFRFLPASRAGMSPWRDLRRRYDPTTDAWVEAGRRWPAWCANGTSRKPSWRSGSMREIVEAKSGDGKTEHNDSKKATTSRPTKNDKSRRRNGGSEARQGGKEERRKGGKEERRKGGKEERRQGGKEERRKGGKEERRKGRKEERRQGGKEARRKGGKEERRKGGKEERRKGGKEERRKGGKAAKKAIKTVNLNL